MVDAFVAGFGGLVGAYLQAVASAWLGDHWGLPRFDVAESGKRYLGGEKPGWWAVGMIFHLVNGILLGLFYGAALQPFAATWLGHSVAGGLLAGLFYGLLIWLVLLNLVLFPLSGAGPFGRYTGSARLGLVTLLLQLVYGSVLGMIYRS